MAKQNILDLETVMAVVGAAVTPNPFSIVNAASHLTTGQSIGANLPGAAGETVRGVEGAVKDAITEATESGADNNKKNNKDRPDFGFGVAHGVGSEQQRRAEARKMKRNVAYNKGGKVSYKSVLDME